MANEDRKLPEMLDSIKGTARNGSEYWLARQLMAVLGYEEWRNFENAIRRAHVMFKTAQLDGSNHFVKTNKMVEVGSGGRRRVDDYFLSRAACYIIAMNGDPTKPEVAEAQKYFAMQTRKMERLLDLLTDQRRVALRHRVKDRNASLSGVASDVGVRRFGLFHGAGIRAMYNMPLRDLRAKRGIKPKEDWLDRAGIEELAATDFRVTQTEAKIRRDGIQGEGNAIAAHEYVAREVRSTIQRVGNTMPEDWPVEPPVPEIERRLKEQQKKIDAPRGDPST